VTFVVHANIASVQSRLWWAIIVSVLQHLLNVWVGVGVIDDNALYCSLPPSVYVCLCACRCGSALSHTSRITAQLAYHHPSTTVTTDASPPSFAGRASVRSPQHSTSLREHRYTSSRDDVTLTCPVQCDDSLSTSRGITYTWRHRWRRSSSRFALTHIYFQSVTWLEADDGAIDGMAC